ncbi:hypothetical protein HXX76_006818 [Chlamydomonas incerta]|uniref:HECT-type E3 ubiquitin transferase n=1 Tax=Chlamydomonas incerta TaxID=51695 RepID=A0A835TET6_CHLIN|nr:hypothetical protein HXX76_006818 [Chlamydomonas incerta]|eukprot:KAG2436520.1 hypothetical protein HXX76_006818 [Chlamydomonas incerta]
MNVIKVLSKVEEAAGLSHSLPPEAFYNALISDKMDVQDHYTAWRQAQELARGRDPPADAPFSFCSYPFLLNARAKAHLLALEARFIMEQSVAHARMEVQLYGGGGAARRRAEEGPVLQGHDQGGGRGASAGTPRQGRVSGSGAGGGGAGAGNSNSRTTSAVRGYLWQRQRSGGAIGSAGSSPEVAAGGSSRLASRSDAAVSRASSPSSSGSSTGGSGSSSGVGSSLRNLFGLWRSRSGRPTASSSGSGASELRERANGGDSHELAPPSRCAVPGVHSDMCIVRVRRSHLVEDALEEVGRQTRSDLLKPLRVHFIGEEGIDAGGVKKEFFALLMERLLDPVYGLMAYDPASRTYWFNASSLAPAASYFLLGLVLGLAVYNRVLLAFPAPLLLYQKLRGGRELGLRDLEGWQPELAKGLRHILEYDGPEPLADVFGLTFSVDVERFGAIETVPLKPGGEQLPVTEDNRAEYVSLRAAWHMERATAEQYESFAAGFRVLCEGPAMSLFNAQELERLVCGNPRLDFTALREAARYEGGFGRGSVAVSWLWDIVLHELGPEEQRAFLKFFTGSDRSPLGGLGSLRPVIQRDGPDSHKLPTAHTCFNTLLLPEYASRTKLLRLLRLAINNSEGFGLQ